MPLKKNDDEPNDSFVRHNRSLRGSCSRLIQMLDQAEYPMRNLAPDITRQRLLIEGLYTADVDRSAVERYLTGVAAHLSLRTYGKPIIHSPSGEGKLENAGFDAFIPLIDSGISLYVWSERKFFAAVLFTCKAFDVRQALEFTQQHFGASQLEHREF